MIDELTKACKRNGHFKTVYGGLHKLLLIHKEERDQSIIPEIIGEIVGSLILIETNLDGYEEHLELITRRKRLQDIQKWERT